METETSVTEKNEVLASTDNSHIFGRPVVLKEQTHGYITLPNRDVHEAVRLSLLGAELGIEIHVDYER